MSEHLPAPGPSPLPPAAPDATAAPNAPSATAALDVAAWSGASAPILRHESREVTLHPFRRDGRFSAIFLCLVWIFGLAFMVFAPTQASATCWAPFLLLGTTAVLLGRNHGAPVVGARMRGEPGVLEVSGGAVEVEIEGDGVRLAREEVVAGWTESLVDGDVVVLETRSGTLVRARVGDARGGAAVLRAAGVAPEQRAVAFRLGVVSTGGMRAALIFAVMILAPVAVLLVLITVVMLGSGTLTLMMGLVAGLPVLGLWFALTRLVSTTLGIGTDGVLIRRLWRRRFIPRAALLGVRAQDNRVVIEQAGRAPLSVLTSGRAEAAAVVRRIQEALADRGGSAASPTLDHLDRRGRTLADWLRDLRALAAGPDGYRRATLDRRTLLDVLEDGAAAPERRLAAAVALSGSAEEEVRTRVRVAAQACVEPRLREAIERVGTGEGEIEEDLVRRATGAQRGR